MLSLNGINLLKQGNLTRNIDRTDMMNCDRRRININNNFAMSTRDLLQGFKM